MSQIYFQTLYFIVKKAIKIKTVKNAQVKINFYLNKMLNKKNIF